MHMTDFVIRESIIPSLKATSKEEAIREMVESLKASKHISANEHESVVKAILKREQLGSTGIGKGVAIPHTKHESVERLIGSVAVSQDGVPFDSLDGGAVHVLVMLISPQDRPGDHLRALENVSRNLRDEMFCRFLKQAGTVEAIWDLLKEVDGPVAK